MCNWVTLLYTEMITTLKINSTSIIFQLQFTGIIPSVHMSLSKRREIVKDREAWRAAVHGSQRIGYN